MSDYKTVKDIIEAMRQDAEHRIALAKINHLSFNEMAIQGEVALSLKQWANEFERFLYGDLAAAASAAERDYKRVESPTKTVHAVEYDYDTDEKVSKALKGHVTTMCRYNAGWHNGFIDAYAIKWPKTDKRVTCANCLSAIARRLKQDGNDEVQE